MIGDMGWGGARCWCRCEEEGGNRVPHGGRPLAFLRDKQNARNCSEPLEGRGNGITGYHASLQTRQGTDVRESAPT